MAYRRKSSRRSLSGSRSGCRFGKVKSGARKGLCKKNRPRRKSR